MHKQVEFIALHVYIMQAKSFSNEDLISSRVVFFFNSKYILSTIRGSLIYFRKLVRRNYSVVIFNFRKREMSGVKNTGVKKMN